MTHSPRWRVATIALLACLPVAATSACSDGESSDGPRATITPATTIVSTAKPATTTSGSTTTTGAASEESAKDAYVYAFDAYFDVLKNPNPDDPRIAETRTGSSFDETKQIVAAMKDQGLVVEYPHGVPVVVFQSVQVDGRKAQIKACLVNSAIQVRVSDGVTVNDRVTTAYITSELVLESGRWKVSSDSSVVEESGECAAP